MVNQDGEAADLAKTDTQTYCQVGDGWGYTAVTASKDGAQRSIHHLLW